MAIGATPHPQSSSRRSVILVSAVAMQLCLGATYSWSVFVKPLRDLTGLTQSEAQLPFTVFYFAFPATMIVAGMLLHRIGPRACALGGGALFGSGWLLASLGTSGVAWIVVGIGLLAGIGVGLAYVVPIAVLVQWYPERKGLITGVAVAGFGGGAALIGHLAGTFLLDPGTTPFHLFRSFGLVFLVVVLAAGSRMSFPGNVERPAPFPLTTIIRRREFRVLYAAMIAGLAAGFAVNANMKELSPGATVETGVTAVAMFAVANAAGRILWGLAADWATVAGVVAANLLAQAVVIAVSGLLLEVPSGVVLFAGLTGFNYGGVLVVYASSAARIWGAEHVGQVYGLLFSANILAAPAPIVAGWVYDVTGGFQSALAALVALVFAAGLFVVGTRRLLNAATGLPHQLHHFPDGAVDADKHRP